MNQDGNCGGLQPDADSEFSVEARRFFLNELRQARLRAQQDAEAYDQLLFVFERLGCFRFGKVGDLGKYKKQLLFLANQSPLGRSLEEWQAVFHSDSPALFSLIKEARNDALHQGATARHLTEHAIEFALILEDALMNGHAPLATVADLTVRSPIKAEKWQPVSFVRQIMLANSFSSLPIFFKGGWKVITDEQLAEYLQVDGQDDRKVRLCRTLEDAWRNGLPEPVKASRSNPKDILKDLVWGSVKWPILSGLKTTNTRMVDRGFLELLRLSISFSTCLL